MKNIFVLINILLINFYLYSTPSPSSTENELTNPISSFLPLLSMIGLICFIVWIVKRFTRSGETKNTVIYKDNKYMKFVGKNYKDILQENNLEEYIDIFTENKLIDVAIISELTDSELEKIGITSLGDRKKILKIFSTE